MNKTLLFFFLICILLIVYIYPRSLEVYKPINMKEITWHEIFDLKTLDKDYIAQGIEVYNEYLFYTVHKNDKASYLLVFEIKPNKNLEYLFTTNFPKVATHVSDLSVYANSLYAIDYASNNLYQIDVRKTLNTKTLTLNKTMPTNISKSGSIIVTNYDGKDILLISQFIINNNIQVFNLADLKNKHKKSTFQIESKYFIQGLYKNNDNIFITSNTYGVDPIFMTKESTLFNSKQLNNKDTITFNGPGNMIEDIVIFNDYIITSDEETNKIYISKEKITNSLP